MKYQKRLSPFAILAASSFGLCFSLLIFALSKSTTYEGKLIIFSLLANALTMVVFNWQTLSGQGKKKLYSWSITASILLLAVGIFKINFLTSSEQYVHIINKKNDYLVFFLFNTVLIAAYLLSLFNISSSHHSTDENFNQNSNHFLFNSLVYGGFFLLTTMILALGFALLHLIGIQLWDMLDDLGQSLVIGCTVGITLLFLNLIPSFSSEYRSPAFLFIFPSIILVFVAIYLFALPFTDVVKINIDSSIRLSTAGILWLFLLYLNDPQRRILNAISAAAGLILTSLSLHGMMIRIEAYGLTIDRIYALVGVAILLTGHGFIFLKAIMYKKFPTLSARCLPLMMFAILSIFLSATFLPAVRWSLESQIALYTTGGGDISRLRKYDFERFGLEGEKALATIRNYHQQNPEIVAKIDSLSKSSEEKQKEKEMAFLQNLQHVPSDLILPPPVEEKISKRAYRLELEQSSIVLQTDINHDGKNEIVAFLATGERKNDLTLYTIWLFPYPEKSGKVVERELALPPEAIEKLKNQQWQYQRPQLDDLKIEGLPPIHF